MTRCILGQAVVGTSLVVLLLFLLTKSFRLMEFVIICACVCCFCRLCEQYKSFLS